MPDYRTVAKTSDIPAGHGKAFRIKERRIAIFNNGGNFCAMSSVCPHAMGPLERGRVRNGTVICPVHGYAYNTRTGICETDPRLHVQTYEVMVENDDVKILS